MGHDGAYQPARNDVRNARRSPISAGKQGDRRPDIFDVGTNRLGGWWRVAATKFGVNAFSESLRQELAVQGVRVVVVEPGFVATDLASHITDPAMRAMAQEMQNSMRTLQPEDIAAAVLYAVSQPSHVSVNELLIRPTDQTR
jgi:hypothetical protein